MMNLALPEMMLRHMDSPRTLSVAGECSDMNVLEKQRARFKWHQEYQQPSALGVQKCSFRGSDLLAGFCDELVMSGPGDCCGGGTAADSVLADMVNRQLKVDPGFQNGWPEFGGFDMPGAAFENCGYGTGTGSETNRSVSRTSSFLPPCTAAETTPVVAADTGGGGSEKAVASQVGRESFKKRKHEKAKSSKVEDDTKAKKRRGSAEDGESKVTTEHNNEKSSNNSNRETSATTSKDNSRVSEVQKPDYIHVRARRGQATDSHSLAERARREKISERMKYLQDLVPGCNKITGKAGMLDEIINYVQSLQRQVEFLSMKLAAVTPSVDFNINSLFAKEQMFPNSTASFPGTIDLPTELTNAAFIHFNPAQNQVVSCSAMQSEAISNANAQRTMGCPMPIAETSFDSSCFNNSLAWNFDIPNLFDYQGRSTNSFEPAQFTGPVEASNLKMEI